MLWSPREIPLILESIEKAIEAPIPEFEASKLIGERGPIHSLFLSEKYYALSFQQ